ncbi:MAG: hypothetical protein MJY62_05575, partial [Bacteroidales bacterium]|nr:hypothetical protein [Bacteroidales bacterium]
LSDALSSEAGVRADYEAGRATSSDLMTSAMEVRSASEEYIDRILEYRTAVSSYLCRYSE